MYRYFLWGKRAGENIIKPFAVLRVFEGSRMISLLERLKSDSSQQNLWILLAISLQFSGYYLTFPPIWDAKGHINEFWFSGNNVIMDEIPAEDIDDWIQSYPVFNVF
jgi:hypothetical protein